MLAAATAEAPACAPRVNHVLVASGPAGGDDRDVDRAHDPAQPAPGRSPVIVPSRFIEVIRISPAPRLPTRAPSSPGRGRVALAAVAEAAQPPVVVSHTSMLPTTHCAPKRVAAWLHELRAFDSAVLMPTLSAPARSRR